VNKVRVATLLLATVSIFEVFEFIKNSVERLKFVEAQVM
jgi:hypothetical protein